MSIEPFETAHAQDYPTVRQLSIFIENRVGQMLRMTRLLDQTDVHILAISVVNSMDCAVVRLILDDPDQAEALFRRSGFSVSEAELIVVSLPHGKRGLLHTWAALMAGEVNIHYTYPLLVRPHGAAALAVQADSLEMAVNVLRSKKLEVLDQTDLTKGY